MGDATPPPEAVTPSPDPLATAPVVAVQPLGDVDPTLVRAAAERIGETFAARVVVLPDRRLPESAFYSPRNRYRGERLLRWLEEGKPSGVSKILGLMSRDLSVTKGQVYDWGVMGVAGLSRPAGVVSVHRLRGHHASPSLVDRRVQQVAVHELGHTFGLHHCPSPRCIMNDAKGGFRAVDRSSGEFCPDCRRRLRGLLREDLAGGRSAGNATL